MFGAGDPLERIARLFGKSPQPVESEGFAMPERTSQPVDDGRVALTRRGRVVADVAVAVIVAVGFLLVCALFMMAGPQR